MMGRKGPSKGELKAIERRASKDATKAEKLGNRSLAKEKAIRAALPKQKALAVSTPVPYVWPSKSMPRIGNGGGVPSFTRLLLLTTSIAAAAAAGASGANDTWAGSTALSLRPESFGTAGWQYGLNPTMNGVLGTDETRVDMRALFPLSLVDDSLIEYLDTNLSADDINKETHANQTVVLTAVAEPFVMSAARDAFEPEGIAQVSPLSRLPLTTSQAIAADEQQATTTVIMTSPLSPSLVASLEATRSSPLLKPSPEHTPEVAVNSTLTDRNGSDDGVCPVPPPATHHLRASAEHCLPTSSSNIFASAVAATAGLAAAVAVAEKNKVSAKVAEIGASISGELSKAFNKTTDTYKQWRNPSHLPFDSLTADTLNKVLEKYNIKVIKLENGKSANQKLIEFQIISAEASKHPITFKIEVNKSTNQYYSIPISVSMKELGAPVHENQKLQVVLILAALNSPTGRTIGLDTGTNFELFKKLLEVAKATKMDNNQDLVIELNKDQLEWYLTIKENKPSIIFTDDKVNYWMQPNADGGYSITGLDGKAIAKADIQIAGRVFKKQADGQFMPDGALRNESEYAIPLRQALSPGNASINDITPTAN